MKRQKVGDEDEWVTAFVHFENPEDVFGEKLNKEESEK